MCLAPALRGHARLRLYMAYSESVAILVLVVVSSVPSWSQFRSHRVSAVSRIYGKIRARACTVTPCATIIWTLVWVEPGIIIIIIINCFSVQQNSYELKTNETVTTSEVLTVCQQLAYSLCTWRKEIRNHSYCSWTHEQLLQSKRISYNLKLWFYRIFRLFGRYAPFTIYDAFNPRLYGTPIYGTYVCDLLRS